MKAMGSRIRSFVSEHNYGVQHTEKAMGCWSDRISLIRSETHSFQPNIFATFSHSFSHFRPVKSLLYEGRGASLNVKLPKIDVQKIT